MKRTRMGITIDKELAAELQALVGQLKAAAVRKGGRPEGVSISSVVESALRAEIDKQRKKLGA